MLKIANFGISANLFQGKSESGQIVQYVAQFLQNIAQSIAHSLTTFSVLSLMKFSSAERLSISSSLNMDTSLFQQVAHAAGNTKPPLRIVVGRSGHVGQIPCALAHMVPAMPEETGGEAHLFPEG